jgi:SAM-dependent methyltransferase
MIVPENSVPSQKIPASSLIPFIEICLTNNLKTIIDVGSGRMRNLLVLLEKFEKIWAVDTALQFCRTRTNVEKVQRKYRSFGGFIIEEIFHVSNLNASAAICICVLHIIPKTECRYKLLRAINRNLQHGGLLLIDVPYGEPHYKSRLTKNSAYRDGFILGKTKTRTFYKEFKLLELRKLLKRADFSFVENLNVRRHHALVFKKNYDIFKG